MGTGEGFVGFVLEELLHAGCAAAVGIETHDHGSVLFTIEIVETHDAGEFDFVFDDGLDLSVHVFTIV